MTRIEHVQVQGLFGYAEHNIDFRADGPTIITGPNGAGKTHVLRIVKSALGLETAALATIPFEKVTLRLEDGRAVQVERAALEDRSTLLTLSVKKLGERRPEDPITVRVESDTENARTLPPFIEELSDGTFYDARRSRAVSPAYVRHTFGVDLAPAIETTFRERPGLLAVLRDTHPSLIDTKRLDAVDYGARADVDYPRSARTQSLAVSSIERYINRIRAEVTAARQESIRVTQSRDLNFAARALAVATETVNERLLKQRYNKVVDSYERLSKNRLAIGEAPLEFPKRTTPTIRRILKPFLDDWEIRLQPLLPVNEKLETLRDILDSKLGKSGKATTIDANGRLAFETKAGRRIRVSSLSSGEQHLVALFTLLLFASRQGSLVLIDEPEISMHAAWKHAFLDDISRVAEIASLQVVIATHSTAIVNGRWDLEETLRLTLPPEPESDEVDEIEPDLDDLFT